VWGGGIPPQKKMGKFCIRNCAIYCILSNNPTCANIVFIRACNKRGNSPPPKQSVYDIRLGLYTKCPAIKNYTELWGRPPPPPPHGSTTVSYNCNIPLRLWHGFNSTQLCLIYGNKMQQALCAWRHDMPRSSPPTWAPQRLARRRADATYSSSFPRPMRSHGHRCTCLTR